MALTQTWTQPQAGSDYRSATRHRSVGFGLALIGLVLATITLIANIAAGNQIGNGEEAGDVLAWSFGLTTTAFGTIKFGIAVILIGILVRVWHRWESMRVQLPELRAEANGRAPEGDFDSPYGAARATENAPGELPIHKMARTMWSPMLAMGAMLVVVGLIVSLVWSANVGTETGVAAASWTQGLQFLGEGMLLAGISFLLGSILGLIRRGGGEVQRGLGLTVKTLRMPATAKAFVALMALGLMVSVAQFVLYIWVTTLDTAQDVATQFAWLGPFRELGLGLLLLGIVLALATIAKALGFQAWRVREIITTGS